MEEFNLAFGANISPEDPNQWQLASVTPLEETYPESQKLDTDYMYPRMQGKQGCCVGSTLEEVIAHIIYLTTGIIHVPDTDNELSFRFLFALAKCLEGKPGYEMYPVADDGSYPLMVVKILKKYGIPLAKYYPNNINLDKETFMANRNIKNIPQEAFDDALTRRIDINWFTVPNTSQGIKKAINFAKENNGGVAILRRVGDTYWKDKNGNSTWDKNRILPIRVPKVITSGHEEFLTGYDGDKIFWLNHWSNQWADNGRGWEYLSEWLKFINEIIVIVPTVKTQSNFTYNFTKTIKYKDKGSEVVALQHKLKILGFFTYPTLTGFYGPLTAKAVLDFQIKNHVAPMSELTKLAGRLVGPATRKQLNA